MLNYCVKLSFSACFLQNEIHYKQTYEIFDSPSFRYFSELFFRRSCFCRIKSNERNEYSYTGLADFFFVFFQENVLKLVHAQF